MKNVFFSSLRNSLVTLVCLAVLPALGVILHSSLENRERSINEAQGEALRVAQILAREQQLITMARGVERDTMVNGLPAPSPRTFPKKRGAPFRGTAPLCCRVVRVFSRRSYRSCNCRRNLPRLNPWGFPIRR